MEKITPNILLLVNRILATGDFPEEFKTALITRNNYVSKNYRKKHKK